MVATGPGNSENLAIKLFYGFFFINGENNCRIIHFEEFRTSYFKYENTEEMINSGNMDPYFKHQNILHPW